LYCGTYHRIIVALPKAAGDKQRRHGAVSNGEAPFCSKQRGISAEEVAVADGELEIID
jgi:hypothetical protein